MLDQVRRRRGLQGDLASQGSRVGGGGLGGVEPQTRCRRDHHPVPVSPNPGEGPEAEQKVPAAGESSTWSFCR